VTAALCAAGVLLGGAETASGQIVVDHGIAGVKLGASRKAVRHIMGRPNSKGVCGSSPSDRAICGGPGVENWYYNSRKLSVTFIHGRTAELSTTSAAQRTKRGIGVGVGFAVVKRKYPHGTVGGRPGFKWYFLRRAPKRTGDLYTLVDSATGRLRGKIRDVAIGRYDKRYACAFFACE
jgi:hypothetical protein